MIGLIAGIWLLGGYGRTILVTWIFSFMVPFVVLMIFHYRLSKQKSYAETVVRLCRNELAALDYDFSAFDGAEDKTDPSHPYSSDMDIFGNHSLFQSLNRTVTRTGRETLAGWFTDPPNERTHILARQEAVRELAGLPSLRQRFYTLGSLASDKHGGGTTVEAFLGDTTALPGEPFWRIAIWIVPALWAALIAGNVFGVVPAAASILFFMVCLPLSYVNMKRINGLHRSVDKTENVFSTCSELIRTLEEADFAAPGLTELREVFFTDGERASSAIRQLSRLAGALDQRFNLAGLAFNILLMRDTRTAIGIEAWRRRHACHARNWFAVLGQFDALCSLGGFAYNHPTYPYPSVSDEYFKFNGRAVGHPLIPEDLCVRNDIRIEEAPRFLIVTGANMAGKSTFLRTVGVNFLLACVGAPVCAEELTVYPARLATSLRTTDSLAGSESYFFAELKRLKAIIDRLQSGEKLFIILDEILKGTNSVDKQKGSLALVRQLVSLNSCGIIATHDLILGTLAEEFPPHIRNFRFEADITDDELTFSYRIREGIAQNMNATFLMKKMGIIL